MQIEKNEANEIWVSYRDKAAAQASYIWLKGQVNSNKLQKI